MSALTQLMLTQFIKYQFTVSDFIRDFGLQSPKEISRVDHLYYGDEACLDQRERSIQRLDLYYPKDQPPKKGWPLIISVHGGAWVYGDKNKYQYYCMDLAGRGFAVLNFTYHLAPKYSFPLPLSDLNQVITWLYHQKGDYPLDLNNVFLVGDSAGAYLLSLYLCLCQHKKLQEAFEIFPEEKFVARAIALNCGNFRIQTHKKKSSWLYDQLIKSVFSIGKKNISSPFVAYEPFDYVNEFFPPTFVATGNKDFLRDHSYEFMNQLKANRVDYIFKEYGDASHSVGHVFHLNIKDKLYAKACNDAQCNFFKEWMI